jgi:hydroxymethylbilane synthase
VPIGAWGRIENGKLVLDVAVLSPDGTQRMWEKDSGLSEEAEEIGKRVAQKLRDCGAAEMLERESRGTRA